MSFRLFASYRELGETTSPPPPPPHTHTNTHTHTHVHTVSSEPVAQSPLVKSIQQPHSTHHIKDVRDETVITNPDVCEGSASVEDVHVESGDKVPTASSDGVRGVDVEDVRVVCGASDGVRREGVEVTDGPRDVLFFMRDKTSQTELQNVRASLSNGMCACLVLTHARYICRLEYWEVVHY